jgi:hypothetical protein
MNIEEYTKEKIWSILVEAVHANVMYPTHKSYTRDSILHETPEITADDLASRLGMPTGEALVILDELRSECKPISA